ncbi:unnamed protein product [Knipowitschia caucasica]|uniref:BHLH domain-containing protein n=1 Tax=Knipowitschia caucasica TaxID=637954 RepID=A0AAV2IWD7_KNICA
MSAVSDQKKDVFCDKWKLEEWKNLTLTGPMTLHDMSVSEGAHYPDLQTLRSSFDSAYLNRVRGHIFYSRLPYFHGPISVCEYTFEPAFVRKRNERERQRVRCVNEGYARLREHLPREHLPRELEDKRLSKVDTLRAAIDYIKHLQSLLEVKSGSQRGRTEPATG